jgi:hypothetical protein|tara:strand:- start:1929 stop:2168 length:240 start_codon:yes stop_codon:yes gene_type:complete
MKNNKIIAEFMGVGKHYEAQSSNPFNQYHQSWDWLMPVIAKLVQNFGSGWKFEQGYDLNVRYKEVVKFIKQENEDKLNK